jgi:hypothetical protein
VKERLELQHALHPANADDPVLRLTELR